MSIPKSSLMMKMINPLTYPQKFVFISLLFGLSIALTAYYMLLSQNEDINFVTSELKGLEYQKPLRKIVEELPQYYLAAMQAEEGDLNAKTEMYNLQAQISTAFKSLIALDKEEESFFQTTE